MSTPEIHRTIEAVWRMEAAKIIAAVARMVRDVGVAEELTMFPPVNCVGMAR